MNAVTETRPHAWSAPSERAAASRRFYRAMAIAMLVAVIAGFGRTYFFKELTGWPPAPAIVHWHAALFTSWLVLFLVQTSLVPAGHVRRHRQLGIAAGFLAAAMVGFGLVMSVDSARRGFVGVFPLPPGVPRDALGFAVQAFFDVGLFSAFLIAGFCCRKRADLHKRFMLLATISLMPPALVRIPLPGVARLALAFVLALTLVAAQPIHDRLTRGRVHPVALWGGLAFLASIPLRVAVGRTDTWHTLMAWLLG